MMVRTLDSQEARAKRSAALGWVAVVSAALCACGCGDSSADDARGEAPFGTVAQPLAFMPYLPYPAGITMGVSQGWGGTYSHTGRLYYAIDFNLPGTADLGLHVLAVHGGTVTYRHESCIEGDTGCQAGWGNLIVIDHGGGEFSKYTHFQTDSIPDWIQVGTDVCRGLHIGNIGNTGSSTGSHLHFQFQEDGTRDGQSIPFDRFEETTGVPVEGGSYSSENEETSNCGPPTGCEITIGAGTTVIDDQTDCFSRTGQYWYEESYGHDGHHWFTYTIDEPNPDSTGRWELNVTAAGNYTVEVFVPNNPEPLTEGVTYEIRHDGATDTAVVDQSAHRDSWVLLGTYAFAESFEQHVRIFDNTGEPLDYPDGKRLLLDAVRLTSTSGCSDECSAGDKQCAGTGAWEECGDFDGDPCLEWGGGGDCALGTHCEGGECVPGDPPDGGTGGSAGSGGTGTGGTAGTGGASSAGDADSGDEGGCRLARIAAPKGSWAAGLLVPLLLIGRSLRRRRRR